MDVAIEILLALLGLVIAYYQFRAERRAAKEEQLEQEKRRQEREDIGRILEKARAVESCIATMQKFKSELSAAFRSTDNDPNRIMEIFDQMPDAYEQSFRQVAPTLRNLYNTLLANEERFPMSHGYGRYIVEIRELLDYDAVLRERRRNGYDATRIQVYQTLKQVWDNGGKVDRETAMELGTMTERMLQALEPYYRHAEKLETVLYELQAKYAAYARGER